MQMCACLKEHMRVDYAFCDFSWFVRAALSVGIVKTAADKACKERKTLGQLVQVCVSFQCSNTNVVFPNSRFIDSGRKK